MTVFRLVKNEETIEENDEVYEFLQDIWIKVPKRFVARNQAEIGTNLSIRREKQMSEQSISERLGNKIFALETNLLSARQRLANCYCGNKISRQQFEYFESPLAAMEESIEQLKELKQELKQLKENFNTLQANIRNLQANEIQKRKA
jgi:hypothetical protein